MLSSERVQPMKLRRKRSGWTVILAVIAGSLPAGWLLSLLVHSFWVFPVHLQGNSMAPEFPEGTTVFFSRNISADSLRKDALILAEHPGNPEILLFRRIAGTPGDSVLVRDGILYLNGEAAKQLSEGPVLPESVSFDHNTPSITLKNGEYFLLADTESEGIDSRHFGPVSLTSIKGIKD